MRFWGGGVIEFEPQLGTSRVLPVRLPGRLEVRTPLPSGRKLVPSLTGRVASAERVLSPLDTHKKSSAPPTSLLNTSSFGLANKMVWVGVGVWVKPAGLTQLKSVEYTLRIVLMKLFY